MSADFDGGFGRRPGPGEDVFDVLQDGAVLERDLNVVTGPAFFGDPDVQEAPSEQSEEAGFFFQFEKWRFVGVAAFGLVDREAAGVPRLDCEFEPFEHIFERLLD